MVNVMNALTKPAQPAAGEALKEVWNAEDRGHVENALDQLIKDYGATWRKTTE